MFREPEEVNGITDVELNVESDGIPKTNGLVSIKSFS